MVATIHTVGAYTSVPFSLSLPIAVGHHGRLQPTGTEICWAVQLRMELHQGARSACLA
jgi:hypothetical protein